MAYFPDVSRGEAFKPNLLLSNNVRHLINAMNGFGDGILSATGGMVRLQVVNTTEEELSAGTAVNFAESGTLVGEAVPAVSFSDVRKPYGVIVNPLRVNEIGSCILAGPAKVKFTGNGEYAEPSTTNPNVFIRGAKGAPVIFSDGEEGIILLGAVNQELYEGPFALSYDSETKLLKVKAGYLSRNGEFLSTGEAEITPESGLVCVQSILEESGDWSEPEILIAEPDKYTYPVGMCHVSGSGEAMTVSLTSFRVPVAVLIDTAVCPLSTEAEV